MPSLKSSSPATFRVPTESVLAVIERVACGKPPITSNACSGVIPSYLGPCVARSLMRLDMAVYVSVVGCGARRGFGILLILSSSVCICCWLRGDFDRNSDHSLRGPVCGPGGVWSSSILSRSAGIWTDFGSLVLAYFMAAFLRRRICSRVVRCCSMTCRTR